MKNFSVWLLGLGFGLGSLAMAAGPEGICVRHYKPSDGKTPCDQFPASYSYVIPKAAGASNVCTRNYADAYCKKAKTEYVRVSSVEKQTVCVLDNNQPKVVNLCKSVPQFYSYIRGE